jgi:oxazoline/thiazoline dehydrogenase
MDQEACVGARLLAGSRYRVSRHVILRPVPDGFLVESLLTGTSFRTRKDSILQILLAFTRATRPAELLDSGQTSGRDALLDLLSQWLEMEILVPVDEAGSASEDDNWLAYWEFHDLHFHVRSRAGRNRWPLGATFHLRGILPPEPAIAPRRKGTTFPLQADPVPCAADDPPLSHVLEQRRTRYSAAPLKLTTLGRFLYRTCRITGQVGPPDAPLLRKPYPSAGSLHPLEVYVVAWECAGLERGLYRYLADAHELEHVRGMDEEVKELLREARGRTGDRLPGYPPVLLVVSARFPRVGWKYQSIAYRSIVLEVGILYQTWYLVATALGLAPCALGAGDSDRFARLTGTDYHHETSVGEFVLGGSPAPA